MAYIGNKPANKAVVASDLDPAVITGQTALAVAPADTDEFLISDAGTLKRLDASLIGGGKIGQVVSTTKTDTFSTTSDSFTDITGLSVAITPSASSSKVLVLVNLGSFVNGYSDGNRRAIGRILRGSTDIASGDAATGTEATFVSCLRSNGGTSQQVGVSMNFLDSPSTTSATTYKVQAARGADDTGTVYLNRSGDQNADSANTVSTITVIEVLA